MSLAVSMSCQLKSKATIPDLNQVKKILWPEEEVEEQWDNEDAWNWRTNFEETVQASPLSDNWLLTCVLSMSPLSQVLVIANKDRYVVLSSKWEKNNYIEAQKYQMTYPSIASAGLGDEITSVLCVPIKSLQKSSQGMPDWICIVLGFRSGSIQMYTTEGDLLMTQNFHDEPVQQLKFNPSSPNSTQEFCVLYSKVVITIEVLGLFNSLRALRSCLAKGRALFGSNTDTSITPPPLTYKKFSLQDQSKTNDCHMLGTVVPSQFDHLMTASIAGGFHARYSNSAPVSTGILSLGLQPFVAWHLAVSSSATPVLTDVAYALASKVTSKLISKASGWLGWGSSKTESGPPKDKRQRSAVEPATPVYPKFGLADALREALSVALSPNERLAAVTDSLGRITLVDIVRGVAVRVWKGYREAQCGWVAAWEDVPSVDLSGSDEEPTGRTVAFLVIYIAKRGLLEVWTAQQGTRVAAFNCSKNAKLLYLGVPSCDKELSQCCLLSPDGSIADIVVPFHCALKGDSSQKARELHLLQQLRAQVTGDGMGPAAAPDLAVLMEMRNAGVVGQALDLLLDCRRLNAADLAPCLASLVEQYAQAEALDAESRLLLSRCRLLLQLVRVYLHLQTVQSRPPDYGTATTADAITQQNIAGLLQVSIDEVSHSVAKRSLSKKVAPAAGASSDTFGLEMDDFLRSFELSCGHGAGADCVRLRPSLEPLQHARLGRFIFGTFFSLGLDLIDELASVLKDSMIVGQDLIQLLLNYWLALDNASLASIIPFHKLLQALCNLSDLEQVISFDRPSSWWQKIIEQLSKSINLEQACSAALVCKSLTAEFEKRRLFKDHEKKEQEAVMADVDVKMDDSISDWEDMSVDMVQWNVLLKQLEDLVTLSRLISYRPSQSRSLNDELLQCRSDEPADSLDFTLTTILQKGRGAVTELIARWLTQNLLEPDILFSQQLSLAAPNADADASESTSAEPMVVEPAAEAENPFLVSAEELAVIQDLFGDVRRHLPHSTERDVLLLNVALEYAAMWIRSPACTALLDRSLSAVTALGSDVLRHGMCRLLWSMSLAPIFQDLALLVDKAGRLPKSFATRKINLPSPNQVAPFLRSALKLLDTAIASAMSSELEAPPFIRYDDVWPTCEGATPILEVALRQRLINIDLVLLHLKLVQVLLVVTELEMKGVHPLALFDRHAGRLAFFQDLHSHPPLPSHYVDPVVETARLHFLKQVIVKGIELMDQNQNLALDFVHRAIKLGYEWACDVDELRLEYVHLLYARGKDHLAHEVLPSIDANERLSTTLLNAAGQRLKRLLDASHTASLSVVTTDWLNNLSAEEPAGVNLMTAGDEAHNTRRLLIETLARIDTESCDHFIASELLSVLDASQ